MTITTATLGGVDSSSIADLVITGVRRQVTPAVRDVYLEVPGRAGAWHFPERGGDRELELGLLLASSSFAGRRTAARAVGRWLWPAADLAPRRQLIVSDEPDRYDLVALADAVDVDELLETGQGSATFRTGPFSYSTTQDTADLTLTPSSSLDTFDIAAGADLANELPFRVTLTPQLAIGGFILTVNEVELTYGNAVAGGEVVTVDTDTLSVLLQGQPALTSVTGAFATLAAGTNTVELSADQAVDLSFTWRRRYV